MIVLLVPVVEPVRDRDRLIADLVQRRGAKAPTPFVKLTPVGRVLDGLVSVVLKETPLLKAVTVLP